MIKMGQVTKTGIDFFSNLTLRDLVKWMEAIPDE